MKGRRRIDGTRPYTLDPGDFSRTLTTNGSGDEWWVWFVRAPSGGPFYLANEHQPDRNGRHHHVELHDDGMISVLPQEGNSNSIMAPGEVWHGFIRHGEWVTA